MILYVVRDMVRDTCVFYYDVYDIYCVLYGVCVVYMCSVYDIVLSMRWVVCMS